MCKKVLVPVIIINSRSIKFTAVETCLKMKLKFSVKKITFTEDSAASHCLTTETVKFWSRKDYSGHLLIPEMALSSL